MSILRDILLKFATSLRFRDEGEYYEVADIHKELLNAESSIKDELMRVIPRRREHQTTSGTPIQTKYGEGFNAARSQMISAITKLCEEEK
jgi:hypothetical protein